MIQTTKRKLCSIFLIIIFFLPMVPSIAAYEMPSCSFGSFDAWLSLDGKTWMNTTVTNISFQRGQPFFIKAMIQSNQDHVWLALYLFEPGTSSAKQSSFKIINGPCQVNDGFDLGECMANATKTVMWKARVKNDTKWINGFTPLSITAFFQKKNGGRWKTEDISFSLAQIYIEESLWIDSQFEHKTNSLQEDVSFFLLVFISPGLILLIIFIKRKLKSLKST